MLERLEKIAPEYLAIFVTLDVMAVGVTRVLPRLAFSRVRPTSYVCTALNPSEIIESLRIYSELFNSRGQRVLVIMPSQCNHGKCLFIIV